VLVGYSRVRAIVTNFLYQAPLPDGRSVILDSPMLELQRTVDHGVGKRGWPGVISSVGKTIAGAASASLGELNYLKRADEPTCRSAVPRRSR